MKNLISISLSVLFVFLFATNLSAQQWTDEQKAVWAGVEAYWAASGSSNPMSFLDYFDESYQGWSYENETPGGKNEAVKSLSYWFTKGKMQYYLINPAKIWVNGNFAYVHYYYTQVSESNDGKPTTERGRWTDILMKKGDKWMLVGDHGGEIKSND
ncbi:MAG: nuclear transport factor 2 family protein [Ignavibacteriaceae bacterium]|nr:nuclear transport factor 2 family protein [Ignavibacteriaceae bacterium]